jgi:hypothetical protein
MRWNPAEAIIIEVGPSRVTFLDPGGAPVVLPPVIYVAPDADRVKILGVGTPPSGHSALQIEVLGPDRPPRGISKLDCLVAFFTHGLKTIFDRSLFRMRPDVVVRGADSLSGVFGGYERDLLASALERAGARRVRWPEDGQPS